MWEKEEIKEAGAKELNKEMRAVIICRNKIKRVK
jgi:hypothetical protein